METCNLEKSELTSGSTIIDLSIYSLTSIKKVSYKFTSKCSIKIDKIDNDKVKVNFFALDNIEDKSIEALINDFYNELLDQDLREIIFRETESIRNLILAQAFSKTSLIELD